MAKNNKKAFIYLVLMLAMAVTLTVLMMPRERTSAFLDYREGLLTSKKIVAPFDFEILRTESELEDVREKIKATVFPVFILNDTLNLSLYKQYINFGSDFDQIVSLKDNLIILSDKQVHYEAKKDSLSLKDPDLF
ncbi:MAG: hypothetical protein KKD38_08360, partial [Candidatus Delongbacteria bacterium]|nr:hypothetical protein [Candidatus Delongbacteria bacterium]